MRNYIILVDGENLVFRYQSMFEGRTRNENVTYIPDVFIWHQNLCSQPEWNLLRVNFYTSFIGGEDQLAEVERQIANVPVSKKGEYTAQICPRVFKKPSKSKKTKMVDINICIDALRHSFHRDVEAIVLLSGDSDYLPLIKELMRNGTQVWLGAFSDGLSPTLPPAVDRFFLLDNLFFHSQKQQSRAVIKVGPSWLDAWRK